MAKHKLSDRESSEKVLSKTFAGSRLKVQQGRQLSAGQTVDSDPHLGLSAEIPKPTANQRRSERTKSIPKCQTETAPDVTHEQREFTDEPRLIFSDLLAALRESSSALVKRGMLVQAQAGIYPGRAPLGYLKQRVKGAAQIAPDENTAPFIIQTFKLAAKRKSPEQIVEILISSGLTLPSGKKPGVATVRSVLLNPFYMGYFRFNDVLMKGAHQPLVSQRLFRAAQHDVSSR